METLKDISYPQKKLISGSITYVINVFESQLHWRGEKTNKYAHTGTVNIKSGELYFEKDKLTGGKIEVDLNTIKVINLDDSGATKLINHLMSADFFHVAKFPVATFNITGSEKNQDGSFNITGDISVRGVTKTISFPARITITGNELSAEAEITVNRVDFGASFQSASVGTLPEDIVSDYVIIKTTVKATADE